MINVMIVEDQKMIRGLLEIYVNSDTRYHLVQSIANAAEAPKYCRYTPVDIILMDVMTENGESGLDAAVVIKKEFPKIKIVIVTSLLDERILTKAREIGADSLWYKDVSPEELMDVVERTLDGEHVFLDQTPKVPIGYTDNHAFTKKEKEVLTYLVKGMSYPQIAACMGVEVDAVKYHIRNMLQKTGMKNKLQLTLAVQNAKIIVPDIEL